MKKVLSIITILASLLLTSCASTEPAESTEISWKTSIISTTASAQTASTATAATASTAATAGTAGTEGTATEATTSTTEKNKIGAPVIVGEYKTLKNFKFKEFFRYEPTDKNKTNAKKEEDYLILSICGFTGIQYV